MAKVTNNTQIDTINILTEATSANDTDMFLLQRGSISHKIPKNKLKWGVSNLNDVLYAEDDDSSLDTKLVTERRIKEYIDTGISLATQNVTPSVTSSGPYLKDVVYQNTSTRKLLVNTIIDGGNDIYGFYGYCDSSSNPTTQVAFEYHVSDYDLKDATTFVIIVPPTWYFRLTGDAIVVKSEGWEI